MNKFWTVLSHTYGSKVKSRSFIVSTIITIIIMAVVLNFDQIGKWFGMGHPASVGIIDETGHMGDAFTNQVNKSGADVKVKAINGGEQAAQKAVHDKKIDGYLVVKKGADGLPVGTYKAQDLSDDKTSNAVREALQQVKVMEATQKLGVDPQKVNAIYAPVAFNKIALDKNAKSESDLGSARMLVYIVNFIIYISIISYGSMIVMEIATEKSSRVMELIVSSVSPVAHLLGKIIGVALLGLTQYIVMFAAVLGITSKIGSDSSQAGEFFGAVKDIPIDLIIYAIVFFLLGYFLYAILFATIGSLVSRIEDTSQAVTPVTMLAIIAFMVSIFGLNTPGSTMITVTSFIPFFTPIIMFLRIGLSDVPLWQVAVGIGINLIVIAVLITMSIRVYKGGVLLYGASGFFKSLKSALTLSKES